MKGYLEVENEEWRGICEKTTDLAAEFEGARCRSTVGSMHSEICCLGGHSWSTRYGICFVNFHVLVA
ncbi:hypothetical protein ACS0TY_017300 [Phlomoides rotata]